MHKDVSVLLSQRAVLQGCIRAVSLFLPQRTLHPHLHRGFAQDALLWGGCLMEPLGDPFGDPEAGCSLGPYVWSTLSRFPAILVLPEGIPQKSLLPPPKDCLGQDGERLL